MFASRICGHRYCFSRATIAGTSTYPPPMASVITLRIQLEEIHPPIVRELQAGGNLSMADPHGAIQVAFGWREQHSHLFHDGEAPGFSPETAVSIAEAVADGPIWYAYDLGAKNECSGWTHRITASASAKAIGELRPVALIGGERRGPVEDSGGPIGYTEKLDILADPTHPDHEWIADWAASVTGPWFPSTPESFDIPSIQAELDNYFGHRADERDPHDLSGLVVADDLRGSGDLKPDALLVDFACGLPSPARSEFRQYARRTGLLGPVEVPPEVREQLVAPFAQFLDSVGDGTDVNADITRPVSAALDALGSPPDLPDFARAVLHGPAGIRFGSTTRYR